MVDDMEEVSSESSRKMQDKEETTSKASWTAVTQGKEERCGGWSQKEKRRRWKPEFCGARRKASL